MDIVKKSFRKRNFSSVKQTLPHQLKSIDLKKIVQKLGNFEDKNNF